ncbi:MAG: hypothetical protein A3I03_14590 [Candidatus Rokubacteria bacterium RIFCSPLOWO2_02_FULL_68_19]|nr:MAG: hypothetical protein A3I03_14590 [Candidatus Rokubacteria bacterium RIFCSPLOWO2_02_FULL_68_19]
MAGLTVIVLLATGYFFVQSVRLEEAKSLTESDAIARGVAALIEAREEGYLKILEAYAGRFRFREGVKRRDRAAALVHLRQLAETFPELDWPFLAGPDGVLWAIYPEAPELYGRSFAHRDWYRGVSREWRSYMSEVFPAARDQAPVVSLVMPIRDLDGKVIGIIGSAQRLETIRQWLLPIQVPDGDLYVVDRKGQLVFHRTRFGPEQVNDYSRVPVVERLLRGEEGLVELENPVEGQVRLSAYRLLPALGWGVVVHREKSLVLQRARTLILVSGTAGIFLAAALAFLGGVAVRNQRRTERVLVALEEKTRELEAAQEELVRKERLAILGQLAGGVSHELRNPLGVMKNSVYYLKMVLPEDERVQKHLRIMEREVTTATRIVSDLLDFARAKPPSQAPTDLSELVREVLDRTPLAENVEVVARLAPDLPPVAVDALQVQQVLGNLITNGAQAMPEGGTLTIETARAEGGARVAVSDTGVGIAPENLEKIFQPLFTTKAKGIGLGLAVAQGLAEANGGTISVESAVGRGSRFLVVFPQKTKEE